jgi:hypothetical protein
VTALPAVVETTPVSDDLATDVVVDRYLARVAALTPAQWGTLDAIGQRFQAGDPIARWRRVRRYLAVLERAPVLRDLLTVVGFASGYVADVADRVSAEIEHALLGRPRTLKRWRALAEGAPVDPEAARLPWRDGRRSPRAERMRWEVQRVTEIATAQPRGPGDAASCLLMGLIALRTRREIPTSAFTELYELVEPVIPAATIGAAA